MNIEISVFVSDLLFVGLILNKVVCVKFLHKFYTRNYTIILLKIIDGQLKTSNGYD